jgi:hypothetical protein
MERSHAEILRKKTLMRSILASAKALEHKCLVSVKDGKELV